MPISRQSIPVFLFVPVFLLMVGFALLAGEEAGAQETTDQEKKEETIFKRFSLSREQPKYWQSFYEIPFAFHAQTDPDAEVEKNYGLNVISSFRPDGRFYISRQFGFTKALWEPTDPGIHRVNINAFDLSYLANQRMGDVLILGMGAGLGLMDGLVTFNDARNFQNRLEPFIPLHFFMGFRMGDWQLGLKYSWFSFFRSDPMVSFSRLLVGFGYNY